MLALIWCNYIGIEKYLLRFFASNTVQTQMALVLVIPDKEQPSLSRKTGHITNVPQM